MCTWISGFLCLSVVLGVLMSVMLNYIRYKTEITPTFIMTTDKWTGNIVLDP